MASSPKPAPGAKQMVADLRVGEPVDAVFLVTEAMLRTKKDGSPYLHLLVRDRSGQLPARLWDCPEALANSIQADDFVTIKGRVESYQGQLQLIVRTLLRAEPDGLRLGDFLPRSVNEPAQMWRDLGAVMALVEDPDLKALVQSYLGDQEFYLAFAKSPAAIQNHHAYLGGLIEHTLSMAQMAVKLCENYPHLRRDYLLTGVLLHDVGKTRELTVKRGFSYTNVGNLVGHLVIGVLMIQERAAQLPNFPPEKLQMIQHLILSHHGQYEFGSPKLPMTPEAMALHYLDNLDAKLKDFAETIAEDRSPDPDWTEYSRRLERKLFKR